MEKAQVMFYREMEGGGRRIGKASALLEPCTDHTLMAKHTPDGEQSQEGKRRNAGGRDGGMKERKRKEIEGRRRSRKKRKQRSEEGQEAAKYHRILWLISKDCKSRSFIFFLKKF